MKTSTQILFTSLCFIVAGCSLFAQNEFAFGTQKIKIAGTEICSYTINKNSHLAKDYLDVKNGVLLYTTVEFEQGLPVHIEMTECRLEDLDKASCAIGASDQKSTYTPGDIYILYLYTIKDQVNIFTTTYPSPGTAATVEKSSIGRVHFSDYKTAENYLSRLF